MTKLTPEQQELLENWGLKLSKILANEIEGYKSYHRTHAAKDAIMVECSNFEINELIRSLLAAKDAQLADAVEKERERIWERLNTDFGDGEDAIVILSSDSEKPTQRPALNELKQIIYPTKNDQQ